MWHTLTELFVFVCRHALRGPYLSHCIMHSCLVCMHIRLYCHCLTSTINMCVLCRKRQSFIHSDNYYCESGATSCCSGITIHLNDPLWDGQQCGESLCCTHPSMPWFIKTLNETTTENIELRLCKGFFTTSQILHWILLKFWSNKYTFIN